MLKKALFPVVVACVSCLYLSASAAAAEKLTSEQVLRKCAEVYKSARTYYEESDLTRALERGGKREEQKEHVVTAFRRPSTLLIKITGKQNVDFYLEGKTLTIYNVLQKQYTKMENVTLQQVADASEYPIPSAVIADDPYAALLADANKIGELKEVTLDSTAAYEIDFDLGDGIVIANYFDRTSFHRMGVKTVIAVPPDQGGGTMTVSMIASKVLIDELPKDAAGKPVDVFAFSAPAEAQEIKPGQIDTETKGLKDQPAPDWTLKDAAGKDVRLADLKGKVVLLDFWATTAGPSVEGFPELLKLADSYKDKPFAFYAVNDSEDPAAVAAYLKTASNPVPVLIGAGTTVGQDYHIVALPTFFVIDGKGIVREVIVGVAKVEDLKAAIDKALAQPAQ